MPTEATGLEHVTPVDIDSTSATERGGFRKCRRQWFLTTVHRLDPNEPSVALFLGNVYHRALEAYYRKQMEGADHDDREVAALDAYQEAFDEALDRVREQMGGLARFGLPAYREAGELGIEMLQNYMEREREDPLFDEVTAVEFRVNVDILDHSGDVVGYLSVQADAVGVKDGETTVADHKTASRVMPSAHLDLDDQLSAEAFTWWRHSGDFPDRVVYNVSYKKTPHPPKLLKKGGLSKDRGQVTTPALYREAIREHGLSLGDYAEHLAWLDRKHAEEDPLFRREATFRTPGQMAAFERDLREEFLDMRDVAAFPERAYPNPTSENCSRCSVRAVCTTIQDDGDVETIIRSGYVVADPRR